MTNKNKTASASGPFTHSGKLVKQRWRHLLKSKKSNNGEFMEIVKKECVPFSGIFTHAGTLVRQGDQLYVACFTGSYEGCPDCSIEIMVLKDNEWRKISTVRVNTLCHWNPVLDIIDGRLHCWFHTGLFPTSWALHLLNMETMNIKDFPAGVIGPVRKANFLDTSEGCVCFTGYETSTSWNIAVHVGGRDLSGPMHTIHSWIPAIQPVVWKEGRKYKMLARSKEGLVSSISDDGINWNEFELSFKHPNSGFDMEAGYVILNNSEEQRSNLIMGNEKGVLELETIWMEGTGEVSYPQARRDGDFMDIVYTGGRCNIIYARVRL